MSKMDNLRAMREARYEQAASRTPAPTRVSARAEQPSTPATERPSAARTTAPKAVEQDVPGPALCGHRAISGRTCTREQGHAAKSHRYS